jgi:glycine/D-amino acid oxidase-like deaminating enzyme
MARRDAFARGPKVGGSLWPKGTSDAGTAGCPTIGRMASGRIVICGAGVIGAATAWFLARRGARPLVVDRARPAAAASGKSAGFLALDWNVGPLDALARASFALHREIAAELGAERLGYRPVDTLATAAAEEDDVSRYARLPNPEWLDGNVAAHQAIGDPETTAQVDPRRLTTALVEDAVAHGAEFATGVVDGLELDGPRGALTGVSVDGAVVPAEVAVLALGPWTPQAQRWVALPQVLGMKGASIVLGAEAPAQVVFTEVLTAGGRPQSIEIYPRPGGAVYVCGRPEADPLPADPDAVLPSDAACEELHHLAGLHASALRDAEVLTRAACYRPVTLDGIPLIGPVPGTPGVFLATGHAVWGILNAPATGRMVAEMILDGGSRSLDASPFAVSRLPAGRV